MPKDKSSSPTRKPEESSKGDHHTTATSPVKNYASAAKESASKVKQGQVQQVNGNGNGGGGKVSVGKQSTTTSAATTTHKVTSPTPSHPPPAPVTHHEHDRLEKKSPSPTALSAADPRNGSGGLAPPPSSSVHQNHHHHHQQHHTQSNGAWKGPIGSPGRRASVNAPPITITTPPQTSSSSKPNPNDSSIDFPPSASMNIPKRSRAASISSSSSLAAFTTSSLGPPPPGLDINWSNTSSSGNKENGSHSQNGNPSIWANGSPMSNNGSAEDYFARRASSHRATPEISIMSEEEYNNIPKGRSRSKSSSAIFGFNSHNSSINGNGALLESIEDVSSPGSIHNGSQAGGNAHYYEDDGLRPMPDMSSIWSSSSQHQHHHQQPGGPSLHRRASTQPSQQTLMWEALRAVQLATPQDMNGVNAAELLDRFKQETGGRRFSVAPSMVNRFMNRNVDAPQESNNDNTSSHLQVAPQPYDARRRHSMAGPVFDRKLNTKFLSQGFEALGLDEANRERIDDYFENTESRTRAFAEAGKNLQQNHHQHAQNSHDIVSPVLRSPHTPPPSHFWPLFVVEFKAGRTDYFYLPSESAHLKINLGDLAIVEADRGKDLGKVIETSIYTPAQLALYQSTHEDSLIDSHNAVGKEIVPKRLFRLAEAGEVAMLLQKGQDETKANNLCQARIRQKNLAMEIVDAEYQWDRRKLTFYFVADRRIDFRELVRELFKLYKTRIWMCAVNPA